MSFKRKQPRRGQSLCASVHQDDGIDPKEFFKHGKENRNKPDRKSMQLCHQVLTTLNLALAECRDPLLQDLYVETVKPAPDPSRLMVSVRLANSVTPQHALDVQAALERARGLLRSEVAVTINRKRAPELAFCVLPAEEVQS